MAVRSRQLLLFLSRSLSRSLSLSLILAPQQVSALRTAADEARTVRVVREQCLGDVTTRSGAIRRLKTIWDAVKRHAVARRVRRYREDLSSVLWERRALTRALLLWTRITLQVSP